MAAREAWEAEKALTAAIAESRNEAAVTRIRADSRQTYISQISR